MTARTAGFRTRAQVGLRKARSRSTRVNPGRGGVAIHWAGPGKAPATLEAAERLWRQWQGMHMTAPRNWADIAYSVGVTQTGHVLAGRGYGVRTAAQGTNDGNDRFLAVVWIGGEDSTPTQAALDAIEWAVADFQEKGAGLAVRSHKRFHSTACAGPALTRLAESLDGRRLRKGSGAPSTPAPTAPTPTPIPTPEEGFLMALTSDQQDQLLKHVLALPTTKDVDARVNGALDAHRTGYAAAVHGYGIGKDPLAPERTVTAGAALLGVRRDAAEGRMYARSVLVELKASLAGRLTPEGVARAVDGLGIPADTVAAATSALAAYLESLIGDVDVDDEVPEPPVVEPTPEPVDEPAPAGAR